jgi:dihydropyrimidine dehydrogenase (NAD+) subunit PreA
VANTTDWKFLNMNYKSIAHINQDDCIKCGRCYVACEDTSHQSIFQLVDEATGTRTYKVNEDECVGCNLCEITCPVQGCITMVAVPTGKPYMNWTQDPRNPRAEKPASQAAEGCQTLRV